MSYVAGVLPFNPIGAGSVSSSASATSIGITLGGTFGVKQIVIAVIYSGMDPRNFSDAGGGWVRIAADWDGANSFGLSMWATILNHASSRPSLTSPVAGSYVSYCYAFATQPAHASLAFALSEYVDGGPMWSATADSRSHTFNPYVGGGKAFDGAQGLSLFAAGCKNNATVLPTATAPSGVTERFDTGVTAAPSFNVWLGYRSGAQQGSPDLYSTITNSTFWSNTSTRTNRCSLRAFIPVVGHVAAHRGRYGSARRIAG